MSQDLSQDLLRALLIYNPIAGATKETSFELVSIVRAMQVQQIVPTVFLIEEGCDLPAAVQAALDQGIQIFVTCGGDGTIAAVARLLLGTDAILGILPGGTQNNIALSLHIPPELMGAVALLRAGIPTALDIGVAILPPPSAVDAPTNDDPTNDARENEEVLPFIEICTIGLGSALFPSIDDMQHGNFARIGDFLTTLIASPPAEISLRLNGNQEIAALGHMVLVSNMPYSGPNYLVGERVAVDDGLLDVLLFSDLSKLELLAHALTGGEAEDVADPRIQRFQAHQIEIKTQPPMPIMVDGNIVGAGEVQIEVQPRHLRVICGEPPLPQTANTPEIEPR